MMLARELLFQTHIRSAALTGMVCAAGFTTPLFAADNRPPDPNGTVFVDLTTTDKPAETGTAPSAVSTTDHVTVFGNLRIIGDLDSTKPIFVDLTKTTETVIVVHAPPAVESGPATPISDPNDPYEETNRSAFQSHLALQRNVVKPVEDVYIDTVPDPVRSSLHNFLVNLEFPVIFINDLLQIDPKRAGATFTRFVVNSTAGVGGIFDIANLIGVRFRDNDFGATLANYGVGDYPYLIVPVIGPTNPRDLSGKVVDVFLNPLHFVALPGGVLTDVGQSGLKELDKRSENLDELDKISKTAADSYAAVRTLARQRRKAEIGGAEQDKNYFSSSNDRN
jgi:phospholipid-binding lipoprotein MlaA